MLQVFHGSFEFEHRLSFWPLVCPAQALHIIPSSHLISKPLPRNFAARFCLPTHPPFCIKISCESHFKFVGHVHCPNSGFLHANLCLTTDAPAILHMHMKSFWFQQKSARSSVSVQRSQVHSYDTSVLCKIPYYSYLTRNTFISL